MTVAVVEVLPAPPDAVLGLLSDVERPGGLGPEDGATGLRRAVDARPERAAQHVAGRAAELEGSMRATLRAAAALLAARDERD